MAACRAGFAAGADFHRRDARGLRGQRWPFGRFFVSPAGLQVTAPGRRSINLWTPREAVISVSLGRGRYGQRLKIADAAGALARVGIEVPFGRKKIIAELRRCGYDVHEPAGLGRRSDLRARPERDRGD